jgi:hypothetical protein
MLKSSQSSAWKNWAERAPAAGVVGDEVGAAVAFAEAAGELAEDVLEAGGSAVAAVHPDDVGRALVARAEPAAVRARVLHGDDGGLLHVEAPGREHRQHEALLVGEVDEVVDVLEVGRIGTRGVVVEPGLLPRALAIGVFCSMPLPRPQARTPWITVKPFSPRFVR